MKKISIFILFIFLMFFYSAETASASVLLEDDFEDGNADGWLVVPKEDFLEPAQEPIDTPWEITNFSGNYRYGKTLYGHSQRSISIPNIPSTDLPKWQNYVFEVEMFPSTGTHDRNLLFRYQDPLHAYGLHLTPTQLFLVRYRPGTLADGLASYNKPFGYGPFHIKVILEGDNIKIYVNSNTPLIDFTDSSQYKISQGIIGLYITTGASHPHTVFFDNVHVTSLEPTLQPLILLPGFGASWNHEAMILGATDKKPEDWYMTPGVKVYDGLIQTLKNAGYETEGAGQNLFVFNYDWTKSVNSIANELKNYISNTVNPPEGVEIDLVGHSLGGLVARTYVQNNHDNPVDQLITLGSPHKGVVQAYYLWEGGDLNKALSSWQRIGAGLLLHIRKPGFSTTKEAVHSVIPSIKDLLPTFAYLKQNSEEKEVEKMEEKNDWLAILNTSPPSHLLSILNTFVGIISDSTLRWIKVENRNWLDEVLNLWPDGKPTSQEESSSGDQIVLAQSSGLGTEITNLENLNHRDLVETTTGQEKIMEILGLSPTSISTISTDFTYEPTLVFQLASPATLSVFNEDGNTVGWGDNKMIVIPSATTQKYQAKITGTGTGEYQLHIGQIISGEDIWTTVSGTVSPGDTINYSINFSPDSPSKNPVVDQTGKNYKASARAKLVSLKDYINSENITRSSKRSTLSYINRTIRYLDKGQLEKSIIYLYRLRYNLSSWQSRGRLSNSHTQAIKDKIADIISDLELAYTISATGTYSQSKLTRELYLAEKYFNKMEDKLQKLASQEKAKSEHGQLYSQASEKLSLAKSASSYKAHINALGAKYLSLEGRRFIK